MEFLKIGSISICVFLVSAATYGQKMKGLDFDDTQYNQVQSPASLMRGDFTPLPSSASLRQYCPKPLSQRLENTSPGWAAAYGALTIIEAKKRNITDPLEIRNFSYSPVFNYFLSRHSEAEDCTESVKLPEVLQSMKVYGTPRYIDFPKSCPTELDDEIFDLASAHRITDYYKLFDSNADPDEKLEKIKRPLSKGSPIIIGLHVAFSFENVVGEFWQPREVFEPEVQEGHAMVVVGYDDSKFGGAFQVMNSWGTQWGNGGFMWIRYKDFTEFVKYAFEIFVMSGDNPDEIDLAGEVRIPLVSQNDQLNSDKLTFIGDINFGLLDENEGYYKSQQPYGADTRFKVTVNSREAAFVYIIGSDESEEIYGLFPESGQNVSAALPYKNSHVMLPASEIEYWEITDPPGTNYLCVIFSKEEQWMSRIEKSLNSHRGKSFKEKIFETFGDHLISPENVNFSAGKVSFEGRSRGRSMVAVFLEMEHN